MKLILSLLLLCASALTHAAITISGQVTDKQGKPVTKCDVFFNKQAWIDDSSIHVTCNENGYYVAEIEAGHYNSLYICDEDLYGKTKLEFWGWNLTLDKSQTINAQFDTMEVYSLTTWASNGGSNSLFASFRPMSLAKAKKANYKEVTHNGEPIMLFDISPVIDSNSISGFIDDLPLTLMSYSWSYEKVASCGDLPKDMNAPNGCYMPMIIAQFEKPKMAAGKHMLRIDLVDAKNGDFGQGITQFSSNSKGLGF
jgi:hypothetical protein